MRSHSNRLISTALVSNGTITSAQETSYLERNRGATGGHADEDAERIGNLGWRRSWRIWQDAWQSSNLHDFRVIEPIEILMRTLRPIG